MSQSNIIVPPEMVKLVDERIRIRQAYSNSRSKVNQLEQLAGQVPTNGTVQALALSASNAPPPQEVETVLPLLEQELVRIQQIETHIQERYATIEEIKRKAKNAMMTLIVCGVVLLIILVLIVLFATHII